MGGPEGEPDLHRGGGGGGGGGGQEDVIAMKGAQSKVKCGGQWGEPCCEWCGGGGMAPPGPPPIVTPLLLSSSKPHMFLVVYVLFE